MTRWSWLRGLVLAGLAVVLGLGLLEFGARFLVPAVRGPELASPALRRQLVRVAALEAPELRQGQAPGWSRHYLLHPYLGFVRDPEAPRELTGGIRAPLEVNAWGFFGLEPIRPADDDVLTVAILGGSFAMELHLFATNDLRDALGALPAFAGREIEVVSLALEGMKQPQQLLALQYVLALGSSIDYVVNVDGFNEVVLPLSDNRPFDVAVHYPRAWPLFASRGLDPEAQTRLGELSAIAASRRARARGVAESWRRASSLALLLWSTSDAKDAARDTAAREALRAYLEARSGRRSLQEVGPPDGDADEAASRERAVALWRRASGEIGRLAAAHGAGYLHVLQPNQYAGDTRNFTAWERENAFTEEGHDYRRFARAGYPLLRAEAGRLAASGVDFVDLTAVLDDEPETVYRDRCCHLNERGYAHVARAIATRIGQQAGPPSQGDGSQPNP
ncbi:MAG: hypothetical protein JRH10_13585 [Deltaproteobacteria bacterium]|nr:hypothetical protein [Deltaproteobacteria bacterium]MBW2448425.1 hypothetical protein [Deltaproteobacteria bacterium]